jgi:DNA-binding NarL/FixJ family response regulator
MAEERWDRLLDGQPPQDRRILELLRQGHTHAEIAQQVGVSEKRVQRLLRKLSAESKQR